MLPVIGPTQLPRLSPRDEEGFSSCSMCPGRRAVANHPAGATRRVNRLATSRAAFALTVAGSASGATHFRGHLAFTCVTARQLAPIPRMRLSRGIRTVGFPPACPPSYGASDCYPGRTGSCRTHQPFLDAQPCMRLAPHTAQAATLRFQCLRLRASRPVLSHFCGLPVGRSQGSVRKPGGLRPTCPSICNPYAVPRVAHPVHVSRLSTRA